jgi:aryl-alcohol dehydrogenase-like predicted oxidoreductase
MTAALALGCMNFGKRTDEAEACAIMARALDANMLTFDTANVYNAGASEAIVGRWLRDLPPADRARVSVHTKVGLDRVGKEPEGLSKAAIERAVDGSLTRLGVEWLGAYYLHAPDPQTPIEQTVDALDELHRAGKVRAIGVSNFASWQILEIMHLCDARLLPRPAISQVIYNVLVRQIEIEYLRFAKRYALLTTVYNPLAGGLLARPPQRKDSVPAGSRFATNKLYQSRYWTDRIFSEIEAYRAAATPLGVDLVDFAYAWLAARPGVDSILVGPASLAHLEAAIQAVAKPLPLELAVRADDIWREFQGTDAKYAR